MRAAAILVAALAALPAFAATAIWTGRQEPVTTVTGQSAWRCEYDYQGQKFWRVFKSTCPSTIEVY